MGSVLWVTDQVPASQVRGGALKEAREVGEACFIGARRLRGGFVVGGASFVVVGASDVVVGGAVSAAGAVGAGVVGSAMLTAIWVSAMKDAMKEEERIYKDLLTV